MMEENSDEKIIEILDGFYGELDGIYNAISKTNELLNSIKSILNFFLVLAILSIVVAGCSAIGLI